MAKQWPDQVINNRSNVVILILVLFLLASRRTSFFYDNFFDNVFFENVYLNYDDKVGIGKKLINFSGNACWLRLRSFYFAVTLCFVRVKDHFGKTLRTHSPNAYTFMFFILFIFFIFFLPYKTRKKRHEFNLNL